MLLFDALSLGFVHLPLRWELFFIHQWLMWFSCWDYMFSFEHESQDQVVEGKNGLSKIESASSKKRMEFQESTSWKLGNLIGRVVVHRTTMTTNPIWNLAWHLHRIRKTLQSPPSLRAFGEIPNSQSLVGTHLRC